MLDNIINMGKEHMAKLIQEQTQLDTSKTDEAVGVTKDTVVDGLKGELMKGNFDGVMDLFNGNAPTTTSNPIVSSITSSLVTNLASKLGIGEGIAKQIANIAIPFIMNKLSAKETGQASDKNDLIEQLGFGGDSGIGGLLGGLGGMFGK
ncbi:DUF937 domain-containing protein [Tunicatimonas pelagia]|uniref:DUF937 domain-containing protein n=1 Tax=Tunicatimonas pelagia TaxID=931531 RepID=UPI002666D1F7|nr:DUF937 domain-containing protein [Tunicatimonas pelagia]WKN44622.1 DUF937 domain-containing protein [Tunicatimonas pelagia]